MSQFIDCHTHVWSKHCHLAADRRYTPSYYKDISSLFQEMKQVDVNRAVLVQPSFLGTDNRYLVRSLEQYPNSLRGIVVLGPECKEPELIKLVQLGVKGVRFNLIGHSTSGTKLVNQYRPLIELLVEHGCHLEVQALPDQWEAILPNLLSTGATIVVDHFGRPSCFDSNGFQSIVKSMESNRVWVKLSGWYRFEADPKKLTDQLLTVAPRRLVWGSDYPWTQHEEGRTYSNSMHVFRDWVDGRYLDDILKHNPNRLYGFRQ